MRVYVSGPITLGDRKANIKRGIEAAEELLQAGYAPYCPHLTEHWHHLFSHDWNTWMNLDIEWLLVCEALVRLPGESRGADIEERIARQMGMPIYYSVAEFLAAHPLET